MKRSTAFLATFGLGATLALGCSEEPQDELVDGAPAANTALCINEFMASNAFTVDDELGAHPDWIELFNPGDEEIDLGGYFVTDDLADPTRHELPSGLVLPAGGYLLLWADGMADLGATHLGFSLMTEGEEVGLFAPDGGVIDVLEYATQVTDWSAARLPDGAGNWVIVGQPTPGESNGEL